MADKELIAIFRLEFYRKQKNWKFCHDVKGKTPPHTPEKEQPSGVLEPLRQEQSQHILNKTYNIALPDPEPELEVNGDDGGNGGAGGGGDRWDEVSELNQAFIDGTDRNSQDLDGSPHSAVPSQVWYNSSLMQAQPEHQWDPQVYQDPEKFVTDDNWNDSLQEWSPLPEYATTMDLIYEPSSWPAQAQAQLWQEYSQMKLHYSEAGHAVEPTPHCWPGPTRSVVVCGGNSPWESSLEGVEEFMQAAAAAPHSSELDLASWAADKHRTFMEGCDEFPTRDTEPFPGNHDFVAGSFMNVAAGRGRGRAGGRRGDVCIVMGRPYRIK